MPGPEPEPPARESRRVGTAREIFLAAGRLGLTSFGGPIAHIGYFRDEYVRRRRWLDDDEFADLVGLTQVPPGPASSQLGLAFSAGSRRGSRSRRRRRSH